MNTFDKIIGYDNEKSELKKICDILKNTDKYKKLGVKTPQGLLLHGDPGVGKTLMASCIIEESGRKVYTCRKTKSSTDFIKEITDKFDEAKKNAPSIIFLDDMDKFANEDSDHRNAEEFVTIQSCIDNVKNSEVFVLATANELYSIPRSLMRSGRFDKVMEISIPNDSDSLQIVKYYLSKKNCIQNIDTDDIAKLLIGHSCADIEKVINDAGIIAAYTNKQSIEREDVLEACIQMIFRAPKSSVPRDEMVLERAAYHEAGHAVVAEVLESGSVSLCSVCEYTGDIGGVTNYFRNPNYFTEKRFMDNRVITLLAGRAAIEVKYGDIDIGAKSDLNRAHDIVERFVESYCFGGFDSFDNDRRHSNEFIERREIKVNMQITEFYNKAKKILIENREFLDAIVAALKEKHTLLGDDMQAIKANCTIVNCA